MITEHFDYYNSLLQRQKYFKFIIFKNSNIDQKILNISIKTLYFIVFIVLHALVAVCEWASA